MNAEDIERVAVIGLGTMGHGIAQTFAAAGCVVRGYDVSSEARASLIDRIAANLRSMAEAGLSLAEPIGDIVARVTVLDDEQEAVSGAEAVVEAAQEDLEVKQDLMQRIEGWVAADTLLASNTSSFPMTQIAERLQHPERAVNTHWFNPPHIVPVVEVVPGEKTSEETTSLAVALHQRIGKLAVRVNQELPGFVVNRVQMAMIREVLDLWSRGVASAEDIDAAVRGSMGFRLAAMGPLQIADFGGLDVWRTVYEGLIKEIRSDTDVPDALQTLIDQGHFGTKTGKGIYEYTAETVAARQVERDRRFLALVKLFYAGNDGRDGHESDNGGGPQRIQKSNE